MGGEPGVARQLDPVGATPGVANGQLFDRVGTEPNVVEGNDRLGTQPGIANGQLIDRVGTEPSIRATDSESLEAARGAAPLDSAAYPTGAASAWTRVPAPVVPQGYMLYVPPQRERDDRADYYIYTTDDGREIAITP